MSKGSKRDLFHESLEVLFSSNAKVIEISEQNIEKALVKAIKRKDLRHQLRDLARTHIANRMLNDSFFYNSDILKKMTKRIEREFRLELWNGFVEEWDKLEGEDLDDLSEDQE